MICTKELLRKVVKLRIKGATTGQINTKLGINSAHNWLANPGPKIKRWLMAIACEEGLVDDGVFRTWRTERRIPALEHPRRRYPLQGPMDDISQLDIMIGTSADYTPSQRSHEMAYKAKYGHRGRSKCTPELLTEVIDLRLQGMTWVAINEELGITVASDWVMKPGPLALDCAAGLSKAYQAKLASIVKNNALPTAGVYDYPTGRVVKSPIIPAPVQHRLDVYIHLVMGAA